MVGNAARNNTASAPQQQNEQENSARLAAELFPILAPMDMDNNYLNFSQDTGVSPAEVNSHATSLATRIAGITASHRPNSTQERVTMDERTTTIEERMRTEALPSPTPTPSIRSRQREQNSQINCYSNQDKIDKLVTVFDQQFNMFLRARRARRDTMIRGILNSYSRTDQEISAGRLGTPLQQLDPQRRARDVGTRDGGEQISEDPNEPSSNQTIHNDSSTPSTGAHKQPATNCHRAERPFTHTGPLSSTTPRDSIPGSWPGTEPRFQQRTTSSTTITAAATEAFHAQAAASGRSRTTPSSSSSTATPLQQRVPSPTPIQTRLPGRVSGASASSSAPATAPPSSPRARGRSMERIQEELEEQLRSNNSNHGDRRMVNGGRELRGRMQRIRGRGRGQAQYRGPRGPRGPR
ncbi:hypothetical protein Pst134EB_016390 [Puccinia striiformis f. sp. tritici]|nr:hypothetical protein Pst134EB_016390 [Puccinia striiformis f. sp. tritici]